MVRLSGGVSNEPDVAGHWPPLAGHGSRALRYFESTAGLNLMGPEQKSQWLQQ